AHGGRNTTADRVGVSAARGPRAFHAEARGALRSSPEVEMASTDSRTDKSPFIVRSDDPQTLALVVRAIGADPTAEVMHEIGPPGHPHTLLVSMTEDNPPALQHPFPP